MMLLNIRINFENTKQIYKRQAAILEFHRKNKTHL